VSRKENDNWQGKAYRIITMFSVTFAQYQFTYSVCTVLNSNRLLYKCSFSYWPNFALTSDHNYTTTAFLQCSYAFRRVIARAFPDNEKRIGQTMANKRWRRVERDMGTRVRVWQASCRHEAFPILFRSYGRPAWVAFNKAEEARRSCDGPVP